MLAQNAGLRIICVLLTIYFYVLLARAILSWIPRPPEGLLPVIRVIHVMTEPLVRLFRPLIPPVRIGAVAFDVSFILLIFLLGLLLTAFGCSPVL